MVEIETQRQLFVNNIGRKQPFIRVSGLLVNHLVEKLGGVSKLPKTDIGLAIAGATDSAGTGNRTVHLNYEACKWLEAEVNKIKPVEVKKEEPKK